MRNWVPQRLQVIAAGAFLSKQSNYTIEELYILGYSSHGSNTTIMLGNGALLTASPNFNRPLINRISVAFGKTIS